MEPRKQSFIDRAISALSPRWGLQRERARIAGDLLRRQHYDATSSGRRTQGWRRVTGDANSAIGPSLSRLRELARDLVRNNVYAAGALDTLETQAVGWGIVPTAKHAAFRAWSESVGCDADERLDLAGLQKLVFRTMVESGEVLVRRRWRRLSDGYPLPVQLQVMEPDYIDTLKDASLPNGGRIVQGVEFGPLGERVAYWLFREHPGSTRAVMGRSVMGGSRRVPASEILHIFKPGRPGQVRGPSWFAPALMKFRDFDEADDAVLMKQKIAACLAVITSDQDGSGAALGSTTAAEPLIDSLEPGAVLNITPGRSVDVVQPPAVREFEPYSRLVLRGIGKGIGGLTYESLTGDYSNVNFSSARMGRIEFWDKVQDWRYRILIPQFLAPVWRWAMEAAMVAGLPVVESTEWTAPALPMLEPDKEGLAYCRNIRAGVQTLSEAIRERGYNPQAFLEEMRRDYSELDRLGIVLDSDPRKMTQAGQAQMTAQPKEEPKADDSEAEKDSESKDDEKPKKDDDDEASDDGD